MNPPGKLNGKDKSQNALLLKEYEWSLELLKDYFYLLIYENSLSSLRNITHSGPHWWQWLHFYPFAFTSHLSSSITDIQGRHSQKLTSVWGPVSRLAQVPANRGISSHPQSPAAVHRWAQSARWSVPPTFWRQDRQTSPLPLPCGRRCTEMFLRYVCFNQTPWSWPKSGGRKCWWPKVKFQATWIPYCIYICTKSLFVYVHCRVKEFSASGWCSLYNIYWILFKK